MINGIVLYMNPVLMLGYFFFAIGIIGLLANFYRYRQQNSSFIKNIGNSTAASSIKQYAHEKLQQFSATIMVQSSHSFLSLPKGTLFIISGNKNGLFIQSITQPSSKFTLKYNQILVFKKITIKNLMTDKVSLYRINVQVEKVNNQFHIEYISSKGEKVTCDFVYGTTYEDKAYNQVALKQSDIFEYVNSRIEQQNAAIQL